MACPDKEQQILAAAEELFTTNRFHEVTMDAVCHAAKVGKGTIYRYFKDKDELFFRIALTGSEELRNLIKSRIDSALPFDRQLSDILSEIRSLMNRRRQIFRLVHSEELRNSHIHDTVRDRWNEQRKEAFEGITEIFRRAAQSGAVRSDIPAEVMAAALLGMFRSSPWQAASGNGSECSDTQLVDLFLQGAASPEFQKKQQ